jgi:uncharacterized protein (TIGR03435 family)
MKATAIGPTGLILLALGIAHQTRAQLPASAAPAFEVASIKPSTSLPGGGISGGCHGIDSQYGLSQAAAAPPLGRCAISNGRLSHFVGMAWRLHDMYLIQSEPDWIARGSERFNIEANAQDPRRTTEVQLRDMLQTLLIDRFQLKFHRETVEKSGFALVVGKKGSKLWKSTAEELEVLAFITTPAPGRPAVVDVGKYSMARLAGLLSGLGFGPVIDKTGLTGSYDFTLSWNENTGPALSAALQDQLGLQLEPQKITLSLFVIDSAKRPGEN